MKTDSQLQHDVLDELEWEPRIDHADIGVAVTDGVVTLTGHVKSYAEKLAAENAVRRVSGVRAIAEEIEVRFAFEPKLDDDEIARRILDIFGWNVWIPKDKITVKVENGWVTLTGTVDWFYQGDEARRVAAGISGVTGVTNLIEVGEPSAASDIREAIAAAIKRQAELDAATIIVSADGGKVTLTGKVKSWSERHIAERTAWAAPGVTKVEDNIVVGL